jgi:hypothetical protein
LAKATSTGLFFNSILPARAGEAARVIAPRSYTGTSLAETDATVVVERVALRCSQRLARCRVI